MSFFGLGGFEILLIGAIALFVLGPKRLLEGIREGRKIYTDLKRQRDALQTLITDAIDLEDIKKQVDLDGLKEDVETLKDDLAIDQVAEDVRQAAQVVDSSIPRDWQMSRPPIEIDAEVRDAIPDLDLSGESGAVGESVVDENVGEVDSEAEPSSDADEVKS